MLKKEASPGDSGEASLLDNDIDPEREKVITTKTGS